MTVEELYNEFGSFGSFYMAFSKSNIGISHNEKEVYLFLSGNENSMRLEDFYFDMKQSGALKYNLICATMTKDGPEPLEEISGTDILKKEQENA